jgi:hypothetical protein
MVCVARAALPHLEPSPAPPHVRRGPTTGTFGVLVAGGLRSRTRSGQDGVPCVVIEDGDGLWEWEGSADLDGCRRCAPRVRTLAGGGADAHSIPADRGAHPRTAGIAVRTSADGLGEFHPKRL